MRKLAMWGYGKNGKKFLEKYGDKICLIIDNDKEKQITTQSGINVVAFNDIENLRDYLIAITVGKAEDIIEQCEAVGLVHGEDYILGREYCEKHISLEDVCIVLQDAYLGECRELEIKFKTKQEYEQIIAEHKDFIEYENILSHLYDRLPIKEGGYKGKCACCNREQYFKLSFIISGRETAICPKCGMNSRMRYMAEYVMKILDRKSNIYINERVTPTYKKFAEMFPNIVGSEYFGDAYDSGEQSAGGCCMRTR